MDVQLLREAMQAKGYTVTRLCAEIGIGRKAFWSKCTGRSEFKQGEIVKIAELLGKANANAIFFPSELRKRNSEEMRPR